MESLAEFKEQTAALPVEQRALLASFLLHSLPDPDYDVSDEDIAERVRQTKSGEIETISMDGLHMGVFSDRERSGCLSLRPQIDAITTHETLRPFAKIAETSFGSYRQTAVRSSRFSVLFPKTS